MALNLRDNMIVSTLPWTFLECLKCRFCLPWTILLSRTCQFCLPWATLRCPVSQFSVPWPTATCGFAHGLFTSFCHLLCKGLFAVLADD